MDRFPGFSFAGNSSRASRATRARDASKAASTGRSSNRRKSAKAVEARRTARLVGSHARAASGRCRRSLDAQLLHHSGHLKIHTARAESVSAPTEAGNSHHPENQDRHLFAPGHVALNHHRAADVIADAAVLFGEQRHQIAEEVKPDPVDEAEKVAEQRSAKPDLPSPGGRADLNSGDCLAQGGAKQSFEKEVVEEDQKNNKRCRPGS